MQSVAHRPEALRGRAVVAGLVAVLVLAAMFVGCNRRSPKHVVPQSVGNLRTTESIVATTGMIADAARWIGQSEVEVTRLMGEGVDPHLYKPAPGDLRALEGADLVLYNGLHLEGKLAEALSKLAERKPVVAIAAEIPVDRLIMSSDEGGQPDPHVWHDPRLWSLAVQRLQGAMNEVAPHKRSGFAYHAEVYLTVLDRLHAWAEEQIATIPPDRRVLVTAHDAFAYFGRAFGLEVHGVQGISTDSEASIRDVNALVDLLVGRRVPAVFFESSVPPRTVRVLVEGCKARGHEVRIGGELYSDALGPDDTPEGTYFGMFEHNVRTIVEALSGKPAAPFSKQADEGR